MLKRVHKVERVLHERVIGLAHRASGRRPTGRAERWAGASGGALRPLDPAALPPARPLPLPVRPARQRLAPAGAQVR